MGNYMERIILNTNYHELIMNSIRSKINGELHGNYMLEKDFNTNYHELSINSVRSKINGQLMVIRVKKNILDANQS